MKQRSNVFVDEQSCLYLEPLLFSHPTTKMKFRCASHKDNKISFKIFYIQNYITIMYK